MGGSELHRVLDILPDFVAQFDGDGKLTYSNPAILHAFGVIDDASSLLREQVSHVLATCTTVETEVPLAIGGKALWFDLRLIPELDERGALVSVLAIGRDITRAPRARGPAASGPEDGGGRPCRRRDRARLQQHVERDGMHAGIALRAAKLEAVHSRVRDTSRRPNGRRR